jgi:hypothetical protein
VLSHYVSFAFSLRAPRSKTEFAMLITDLLLAIPKMVCIHQTEEICPYSITCQKEMEKEDAITATQAKQADKYQKLAKGNLEKMKCW